MPDSPPRICLTMIVRDEAHVVEETLASALPHLHTWCIVDTGSTDGTPELITRFFADRGIPGHLHRRPWVDFGHNRTEALDLARHSVHPHDYLWMMDADDLVVGNLALLDLDADSYELRLGGGATYWRPQIFRAALPWRYSGVVHEYAHCPGHSPDQRRLDGDYHIESRRLGARNLQPDKYRRDADLLERERLRSPDDARTVFYLAQSLADAGDNERAIEVYQQRIDMAGWDEERFYAAYRRAQCLHALGHDARDAYEFAWSLRPTRAEPLVDLARILRLSGDYAGAYDAARRAADIAYPADDRLFVHDDAYHWRARDEMAVSAFYLGRYREAFTLNWELLNDPRLPESERVRIEGNRDFSVPHMMNESVRYPAERIATIPRVNPSGEVTLTITAGRRRHLFETTINSFVQCCADLERITRWICIDDGSSPDDRQRLTERYPFIEFVWKSPTDRGHARSLNMLAEMIDTPYWLHLEDDWTFFTPDQHITRAIDVLESDASLGQVLFNRNYAETIDDRWLAGGLVYRTPMGTRFVRHVHYSPATNEYAEYVSTLGVHARHNTHWPHFSLRPSLCRADILSTLAPFAEDSDSFEFSAALRFTAAGWASAFFDGVTCVHTGPLTADRHLGSTSSLNAYDLNDSSQFGRLPRRPTSVRLLANWIDSASLVSLWSRQAEDGSRWRDIELTASDTADYTVVVNYPPVGATVDPARSIVVQMEPRSGVAGWGDWAAPDRRSFLQVRSHDRFPNALEWHLGDTYSDLITNTITKTADLSTVISGRAVDPGQLLRLAFVHHLEEVGIPIDIYGRDNSSGFRNYRGSLPAHDKRSGLYPYRYTFAAENHAEVNYVTEKLIDAILSECLCFYWGCPNVDEIIDPEAYIRLPLEDPAASAEIVRNAMAEDLWTQRLPAVRRAKARLLGEDQILPVLARVVHGHRMVESLDIDVINLDRRPDRWESFRAHLDVIDGPRLSSRMRRVSAVDGSALHLTDELRHLFRGNDFGYRAGVVGCALSHRALWADVAAGDRPRLVFEDDARLAPDFFGRLVEFCGRLHDVGSALDLAFLGYTPWGGALGLESLDTHRPPTARAMTWPTYMGGSFAYIVTPVGARRLLNIAERDGIQNGIDWFVMRHGAELTVVQSDPPLATSPLAGLNHTDSDIQFSTISLDRSGSD